MDEYTRPHDEALTDEELSGETPPDEELLPDDTPPPRPNFFKRLWMVFIQPGELFRALGENPAWFPMALFVAVGAGAAIGSLPDGFWEAQMEASGEEVVDGAATIASIAAGVGSTVVFLVIPLVLSALTYVIFVFMRGDNATFKQHLSVISHAGIVSLAGLAVALPLWIRSGSFEEVLSIGTFFPFLPDGFLYYFLNQFQLFGLWAIVVAGIGLAALDERRSAGPTIAVLMVIQVIWALVGAGCAVAFSPNF